ncbi:hypothetical protein NDU88_010196 [Pleurodeles waltl]|uniref:Uncharacterized protein n=1 Tax=Pleurodeles waltl TaxID=8319 RepID=A0AAV7PV81_PLEWA|nr:hypothetical protein NDU88_010196 [Pleurodeles waltl]
MMEADLSAEELVVAMQDLKSGRATGPSGLLVEVYKGMIDKVAPDMLAIFREIEFTCFTGGNKAQTFVQEAYFMF